MIFKRKPKNWCGKRGCELKESSPHIHLLLGTVHFLTSPPVAYIPSDLLRKTRRPEVFYCSSTCQGAPTRHNERVHKAWDILK